MTVAPDGTDGGPAGLGMSMPGRSGASGKTRGHYDPRVHKGS